MDISEKDLLVKKMVEDANRREKNALSYDGIWIKVIFIAILFFILISVIVKIFEPPRLSNGTIIDKEPAKSFYVK